MSSRNLWLNRQLWQEGHTELRPSIRRILRLADGAVMDTKSYSVSSKNSSLSAPSNDPHDYYSLSPFYWPTAANVQATDPIPGGPYARFDGYTNPEVYLYQDPQYMQLMLDDVLHCSLAYFFTGNETYAATATRRLSSWFVDPVTAMKPSMEYAASVRGVDVTQASPTVDLATSNGTKTADATGVLMDMNKIYLLIDSVGLIRGSSSFTPDHYKGIQTWIQSYQTWSMTHHRAKTFGASVNYQGSWFDVQQVSMLLFLNKTTEAAAVITQSSLSRMALQIASKDGSQPLELARPLSWFSATYNLEALFVLGFLAHSASVDLFKFVDATTGEQTIASALKYMIPFAQTNGAGWPTPNIGKFDSAPIAELCKLAFVVYRDDSYLNAVTAMQAKPKTWNPVRLWTPYLAFDTAKKSSAEILSVRNAGLLVASIALMWISSTLF
ncbi:hypothetical protein BASA81_010971 [Batrachochytrium salamandrivorans]|nr:hypothetical protein BASA81_010971 [Batrachochytrium salamandrivorans]